MCWSRRVAVTGPIDISAKRASSPTLRWSATARSCGTMSRYRHDVTEVKTRRPHDSLARPAGNRTCKDGAVIDERVILAVFTAGVGAFRQIAQQIQIDFPAGE